MALAAAVTVLMAVLPAGLAAKNNSEPLTVMCQEDSQQKQTVTAAATVLTVVCPASWTIDPAIKSQKVCEIAECTKYVPPTEDLSRAVDGADTEPGMTITFEELPETRQTYLINCRKANDSKKCEVEVILEKPPSMPSVQICEQQKASITLKILEKGSSAQFACESNFELYPKEANRVFSKDCKKEETLSDMKRTETSAGGAVPGTRSEAPKTYTLTADKQPSKKTLCYLCARKGTTADQPGKPGDYCTIYVESGARTQLDACFFVLALPCVLAAFQFT